MYSVPSLSNSYISKVLSCLAWFCITGLVLCANTVKGDTVRSRPLPTLTPLLKKNIPAVVNISSREVLKAELNRLFKDPLFGNLLEFEQPQSARVIRSLGSGVIVDANQGLILTNHHVIANAQQVTATLSDGRELAAALVGIDQLSDLALMRIEADDLTAIKWGDSDALQAGDYVVAIGNPFGLGQTVASGIVGALSRSILGIENAENFIQTYAAISSGSSGGALINLSGELVGINTNAVVPNGGSVVMGFAAPANTVREIVQQLQEHGEVRRTFLGIEIAGMDDEAWQDSATKLNTGAVITHVVDSSIAQDVGLQAGDIIVDYNGRLVNIAADVRSLAGPVLIDQQLQLTVLRDGKVLDFDIKVEIPDDNIEGAVFSPLFSGAKFLIVEEPGDHEPKSRLIINSLERRSPMDLVGLEEGDIILSINRRRVQGIDDMETVAKTFNSESGILLNIQRGDQAYFALLK